jgi:hypothetical protein
MLYARTVHAGGKIDFRRRVFEHPDLGDFVGQRVLVMRDTSCGDADCIVFTMDNEHLCNAHNKRRWAAVTDQKRERE